MMTKEDAELYDQLIHQIEYHDRLQYCYKIKLNSCYGALLNKHFRFYDDRLGESTTGSGRAILRYMCSKINELLVGTFDYLGEAVLYGDTDSCYFRIFNPDQILPEEKELILDLAVKIADDIAEVVNASFPEFMRETFLCNDGFDHYISAGREVVAPRGIFVTPKRYMLDVADIEGKRVQFLKVMGLDTKKTTLPKYIQDKLNDFLARYLRDTPWETIADEIVELKDQMRNYPKTDPNKIVELGLPKGVNKVEMYTQTLQVEGENARLPGHVRAAINYNRKLVEYNDLESMRITSGMKIRVFYLTTPDGKFKSIALPTDLQRVPDWFNRYIKVDIDLQIERLVDNPLKSILNVIGRVPPSKQTVFVDSLLEF